MTSWLTGRTIVVLRADAPNDSLSEGLRAAGAVPLPVPVLNIADPADGGRRLTEALVQLEIYTWLVVTSPNGADRVMAALAGRDLPDELMVAAIGPATAGRLESFGVKVDVVPNVALAEGLLTSFPDPAEPGSRVLLARAAIGRSVLPSQLRQRGWVVDDVAAYQTLPCSLDDEGKRAVIGADAVAFTSSSTVTHLVDQVGADALPPVVVCIGPVTAETAEAAGIRVTATALDHTAAGVVAAFEELGQA